MKDCICERTVGKSSLGIKSYSDILSCILILIILQMGNVSGFQK